MGQSVRLNISDIYGYWTLKTNKSKGLLLILGIDGLQGLYPPDASPRNNPSSRHTIGTISFDRVSKEVSFIVTCNEAGFTTYRDFEGTVSVKGDKLNGSFTIRPGYFKEDWSATKDGGPEA